MSTVRVQHTASQITQGLSGFVFAESDGLLLLLPGSVVCRHQFIVVWRGRTDEQGSVDRFDGRMDGRAKDQIGRYKPWFDPVDVLQFESLRTPQKRRDR
ncbi:MAG: hypothetical protein R3E58_01285 [Phycisphaerae bacterium]